jgi:hypothetical protein
MRAAGPPETDATQMFPSETKTTLSPCTFGYRKYPISRSPSRLGRRSRCVKSSWFLLESVGAGPCTSSRVSACAAIIPRSRVINPPEASSP